MPVDKAEAPSSHNLDSASTKDILLNAQNCIMQLRARATGKSIYFSRTNNNSSRPKDVGWACIEKYCTEWFGFQTTKDSGDLMITDYDDEHGHEHGQRVLVVHDDLLSSGKHLGRYRDCAIGHIYPPVGPFRLARCLLALLDTDLSLSEYESSPYMGVSDRSTQTPLGSPEERTILNGIILTDYGFTPPSHSIPSSTTTTHVEEVEKKDEPAIASQEIQQKETDEVAVTTQNMTQLTLQQNRDDTTQLPTQAYRPLSSFGQLIPPQPKTSESTTKKSLHILAVDDNNLNLQLLHRYLLKRKFDTVVTARDGQEAVTAVREAGAANQFDIIFMDISMPNMNGFEATRAIRSFEREFPRRSTAREEREMIEDGRSGDNIIEAKNEVKNEAYGIRGRREGKAFIVALTGLGSKRDREEAEGSGFDDFLTKPVSFAKIGVLLTRLSEDVA